MAVASLYLGWRSRDVRKFLAGAFFVSSGILFYLYLADVSVPFIGTGFVETPFWLPQQTKSVSICAANRSHDASCKPLA